MIAKSQYVEYLISTPINYTCSNLADHLDDVSHDTVTDYLQRGRLTARALWELACPLLSDSPDAYLIVDDSVHDKRHSKKIELVRRQYSGNEHGLVRGIGVVSLVHATGRPPIDDEAPPADEFYPSDFRVYAPEADGKTKHEHFREMLLGAVHDKQLRAKALLLDIWYAASDNLKLIHRLGLFFVTTLKENRLVSPSKEEGYIHLEQIDWTAERMRGGVRVKLKEVPFHVQLFKVVATNGDIDWTITNRGELDRAATVTTQSVQEENSVRWHVEKLHRDLKQLTGSEPCQCRKARSQRNHLACCYHAWLSLKVKAKELGKTLYGVRADLFRDYLRAELRNPRIPTLQLS